MYSTVNNQAGEEINPTMYERSTTLKMHSLKDKEKKNEKEHKSFGTTHLFPLVIRTLHQTIITMSSDPQVEDGHTAKDSENRSHQQKKSL